MFHNETFATWNKMAHRWFLLPLSVIFFVLITLKNINYCKINIEMNIEGSKNQRNTSEIDPNKQYDWGFVWRHATS